MANSLSKQLKEVIANFVDSDGNILDTHQNKTIKVGLDKERIDFLRQFVNLLLNTQFISNETKTYLKYRYITVEGAYEEFKRINNKINLNTFKSKIFYDKKKIESTFGEKVLVDVIEYSNTDMTRYKKILAYTYDRYSATKLLNNLAIRLPEAELCQEVEQQEFNEFIQIIGPYTPAQMKEISENMPKKVVGYAKYLLSSSRLTIRDMERREILIQLLGEGR